jgi:hypothetical protein
VMREGRITETVAAAELREDELLNRCYGRVAAPASTA